LDSERGRLPRVSTDPEEMGRQCGLSFDYFFADDEWRTTLLGQIGL
jgi:hypothetical protein